MVSLVPSESVGVKKGVLTKQYNKVVSTVKWDWVGIIGMINRVQVQSRIPPRYWINFEDLKKLGFVTEKNNTS